MDREPVRAEAVQPSGQVLQGNVTDRLFLFRLFLIPDRRSAKPQHSPRWIATLAQPSTRAGSEWSALGVDPTSEQREPLEPRHYTRSNRTPRCCANPSPPARMTPLWFHSKTGLASGAKSTIQGLVARTSHW